MKGLLAEFKARVPNPVRYEADKNNIRDVPEFCTEKLEECREFFQKAFEGCRHPDQRARIRSLSSRVQLAGHSLRLISIHLTNTWEAIWNRDITDDSCLLSELKGVDKFVTVEEERSDKNFTPFHEFLYHVLDIFRAEGLKREGEDVYERVRNNDGHVTVAWKYKMTIEEFVHKRITKSSCFKMWLVKSKEKDPVPRLIKHLCASNEAEFAHVNMSRTMFSFENGFYEANHNLFFAYPLDPDSPYLSANSQSAAKHFPSIVFPQELWQLTKDDPSRWNEIPTPDLDGVLIYQEIPQDSIDWLYFCIGRMYYAIGEHDDLQYFIFFEGAAGCGKSTTLKVIQHMYPESRVGILSNNIETKFGLSSIEDKWVCIAPEIKHDWKISVTEFQSMASGESVSIAVKNKKTIQKEWTSQVAMAGNEIPGFDDLSGSISRRLLVFQFIKKPTVEDGSLLGNIKRAIGHIILKSNVCYRYKCATGFNSSLWTHAPDYFQKIRIATQCALNVMYAFLDTDPYERDVNGLIEIEHFKDDVEEYMQERYGFKTRTKRMYDAHKISSVVNQFNLDLAYGTRNGELDKNKVVGILGARRKGQEDQQGRQAHVRERHMGEEC